MVAAVVPAARPLRAARDAAWEAAAHTFGTNPEARGTFRGNPADWQFCSELVARCWQAVGILGPEHDPRDVLPVDFFGGDGDGLPRLVGPPVALPVGEGGRQAKTSLY